MNIHEYQAKKILSDYGILIPKGGVAYTPNEAKKIASASSSKGPWILKSQIQSGFRNNGYFLEKGAGKQGGIRKVKSRKDIVHQAKQMLGSTLVTEQTGPKGRLVGKIYVESYMQVKNIFYMALIIDSITANIKLLVAEIKDEDIVKMALSNSRKILKIDLSINQGPTEEQIYKIINFLKLDGKSLKSMETFVTGLHKIFVDYDATMIELSPVGIMKNGNLVVLDAKMSFDDNALYRHKSLQKLQDDNELEERELQAFKYGFKYSEFDGNIGCIVNGDGIALAAMDALGRKNVGTACFLNVKGGVDKDKIAAGIKIIMTNPKVEGILINVLGGFLRCNLIAEGIINATSEVGLNVPLVVRFEGTNKEEAQEILERSKLPIIIADNMENSVDMLLQAIEEGE